MFISRDAYLAYKTPHTPLALCMWLEHRPQCSTSSNRQMGVTHSVAMMERNYPTEYCPPSHTTSNSLDAQYSPNHSIFLVMIAWSRGQDSLMHWNDQTLPWEMGEILVWQVFGMDIVYSSGLTCQLLNMCCLLTAWRCWNIKIEVWVRQLWYIYSVHCMFRQY